MATTTCADEHKTVPEEEWNDRPVPMSHRLGFKEPAIVWSGFGLAFICAVIGGMIQQGLGTIDAILAIVLGNALLFVYAALLGYPAGKWGLNFPLTIRAVFGGRGSQVPVVLLAFLVCGWFAFHSWLTADIIRVAFGIESGFLVALLGVAAVLVYGLPVAFGIKSMALVRKVAIPAMVVFALYYVMTRLVPAGGQIFEREGTGDIGFMTGVGMAWATYVVSGTMTGDIVRYTRTGGQAVGVTAVAFLFSNLPFMVLGALISAAINDSSVQYFLDSDALSVLIPIAFLALLSTWSTADACLYNASLGFSNAFQSFNWRRAAIFGIAIGIVGAGSGVVGNVVSFLSLIGLAVPPIGGVIMADYYFVRKRIGFSQMRSERINVAAIVATTAGLVAGYYVHVSFPNFLFGITGIIVSMVGYLVLVAAAGEALGAGFDGRPSGAEAEGFIAPVSAAKTP
jgi:cytosine permease